MLDIAVELCRTFEGFRSKPYLCPAGVPTIGYGSTYYADGRKVTLADQAISEPDARSLLMHELERVYAPGVKRLCPGLWTIAVMGSAGKFNAIVDFAYNLGLGRLQTSTLRRKANAGDWRGCAEELDKWVMGGGKRLPGLVLRRAAESKYFR
ncbi:MAG: lysozyme [Betaproteobacteria bacterium]